MKHNNFKVLIETSQATGSSFICVDGDSIDNDLLYIIILITVTYVEYKVPKPPKEEEHSKYNK